MKIAVKSFFFFIIAIIITFSLFYNLEIGHATNKEYTGKKIAVDFFKTNIRNVFKILSQVSGKNFAIDEEITGKVTLNFDKAVPWDQVLDLILKMNRLGKTLEEDIVRISTLKTLEEESKLELSRDMSEPLVTEYIPINYANAKTDILPHISLTSGRGSISVDERNNQIIIKDIPKMVQRARETVRRIDKATKQVMIEARIVEATDTFSRQIGTTIGSSGKAIEPLSRTLGNTAMSYNISGTNPPNTSFGSMGIIFSRASGVPFSTISAQIDVSESEGLLEIRASPRILALNNRVATIKQGVKYPLTKLDSDGNTITDFQDVALELQVTPHITTDKRIALTIKVSNNEIGAIINNQTSFTTKEASTHLMVNDGDTVVIGGIKKTIKDSSASGISGLKDIPIIGWLFKRKTGSKNRTELIIFISPKIVELDQK